MRAQRRDEDRSERELRDDAHQRTSRVGEVAFSSTTLALIERFGEHRSLELETSSARRHDVADRCHDFTEPARHSQHRGASAVALPRRDVAQRAEHLRHVHDFGEPARDVVQREAVVVRLAMRLEREAGADAPHRAGDESRRRSPRARSGA